MIEDTLSKIAETFVDYRGKKTSWGRVVGTLIILIIMFTWCITVIRTKNWVALDGMSITLMISIYALQALKSVSETVTVSKSTVGPSGSLYISTTPSTPDKTSNE